MRRFLTAAFLVAIVSTSTACGNSDDNAGSSPSTATSSAASSPSPSVDVKANTKDICAKAEALVTEAQLTELGKQVGFMIVARQQKNASAEAQAKAAVKAQTDTWVKQLGDLKKQAADPALQQALDQLAAGLTKLSSDEYLATINSINDVNKIEADLKAASAGMDKVCG